MNDQVEKILRSLPPEARQAYENGDVWRYTPNTIASGYFHIGNDGENFYKVWFVPGWEIEEKTLCESFYSCDNSGRWLYEDRCEITCSTYDRWRACFDERGARESIREYLEYAARSGHDPLEEACRPKIREVKKDWYFWMRSGNNGAVFIGASRQPNPKILSSPKRLPSDFKVHLDLVFRNNEWLIAPDRFVHPDQIQETVANNVIRDWYYDSMREAVRGTITITDWVKSKPKPNMIKQHASYILEQMEEVYPAT